LKNKRDVFDLPELPTHVFRAGDVAWVLNMEKWRLEKFLTGKQYNLSPYGHLGEGQGSWRLFSHQDIYRLGIAQWMAVDGFTAKFINLVLQEIEDRDLLERDKHGDANPPDIGVYRTKNGPEVGFVHAHAKEGPYYVLKLRDLIATIDQGIYKLSTRR
jgi:hypothetical protein